MKKDSLIDYSAFILIKLIGPLVRSLPRSLTYFLGSLVGELFYSLDLKHKCIAYANIKTAFGFSLSPSKLSRTTRDFYRNFGQNIIEIFLIPAIDKDYINKYICLEGIEHVYQALSKGKGVIILSVHAGGWELTNVISSNLGQPMFMFVRDQRFPLLNQLLNAYRSSGGGNFIQRKTPGYSVDKTNLKNLKASFAGRELFEVLKANQLLGMTVDQGGRHGVQAKFFGKEASMSSGAVKLALKHDAVIIPTFCWRVKGPYLKVSLEPGFEIKKSQDFDQDVRDNLQRLVNKFEQYILSHPKDYLWSYKIYKYSREKDILILNDNKAGHLRQSQGLAKILCEYFKDKDITTRIVTVDILFKNRFARYAITSSGCLAGKYHCQGCCWCLESFLEEGSYKALIGFKPDIVISCGSQLAAVNYVISRENMAKSIVVMRPSIFSTKRFDLVIMPKHDNPPLRKNVAITRGSLNLIDQNYLNTCAFELKAKIELGRGPVIGFLVGGDTRDSRLDSGLVEKVIASIKELLERLDAELLITTSRRTSQGIEQLLKSNFAGHKRCKLLIIANENNPAYALGGILGLSQLVIVSGESISMVSEAASSGRYVVVFKSQVHSRHSRFLKHLSEEGYIYLSEAAKVCSTAAELLESKPKIKILRDRVVIEKLLPKIL